MRRIKFIATTIAMMAAMYSCQKYEEVEMLEEELEEQVTPQEVTSLRAYAPGHGNDNADTRVAMSENKVGNIEIKWMEYDRITIFDAVTELRVGEYFVSTIDKKTGVATFEPEPDWEGNIPSLDGNKEYIAVYPDAGCEKLSERYDMLNEMWNWFYPEMMIDWNGGTDHLNRACCMKTAPFKPSSSMSFAHEMAMMTIECGFPELPYFGFGDFEMKIMLNQSFMQEGAESNMSMELERCYCSEDFSSRYVKTHIMIPPTPADVTGERTVSLVYGDYNSGDENTFATLLSKKTTTPFEAGKRYMFTQVYKLANISASEVPAGTTWTISDSNETATSAAQFEGLRAALDARTSDEPVTLIFPNLTAIPFEALANVAGEFNVKASKVTTLGGGVFSKSANISKIELPSVTELSANEFNGVSSLRKLILAESGRVTSTDVDCFSGLATSSVDLTTHPSNRDGVFFLLADGTKSAQFNSINGQAEVPVTGVEVIVEGAELSGCFALKWGETKDVTVKILPENATNKKFTATADGCIVEINGNVATITAMSYVNELYGYLEVKTEEGEFGSWTRLAVNELGYTIGMLYPNETNPIGVVYAINDDFSGGRIISLDQPAYEVQWAEYPGMLTGANKDETAYEDLSGLECMGKIFTSEAYYYDNDKHETTSTVTKEKNTFATYPALEWVHNKNIAADTSFDGGAGYVKDAKNVWYLLSDDELRYFQYNSIKGNVQYESGVTMGADTARDFLEKNKDRYSPFVGDGDNDSGVYYNDCQYWTATPKYVFHDATICGAYSRVLMIPYDVVDMMKPQNGKAYVRAFMNF